MTRTSTRETFIRHTLDALRKAETQLPSDAKKALARAARVGTSARMSEKTPAIVKRGVTTIIGKGGMSSEVVLSFASRCLYLAFSRGCGILAKERIEEVLDVYYAERGFTEAVWKFRVRDFGLLLVAIYSHGESIYNNIQTSSRAKLDR